MRYSPFVRRQRRAARVALYSSLAVALLLLAAVVTLFVPAMKPRVDRDWTEVDFASLPEVRLLQEYVRIDTSQETGSELAGARFLAERLEEAGIAAHVERLGDRHANLWAIVEGDDPQALVLHSHIDVYPVRNPDRWDYPPFGAEIVKPYLYGRGAFDMKSVAAAQLHSLAELKQSGRRFRRSVIFLATSSEELGSELGTRWVLDRHPELVERFWAVLTEGGIVEPVSRDEIKYWGIEFAQKQFANVWVCSPDRERLEWLIEEVRARTRTNLDGRVTDEVARFLSAYGPTRNRSDYQELLERGWRTLLDPEAFRKLPVYLQSAFRNEVAVFPVEEAPDSGYQVRLVIHHLAGSDPAETRERLLPDWMLHGLSVTYEPPLGTATGSPLDHPAYVALEEVLQQAYPDTRVGPYFVPWSATDSRFFRQLGIPSYGFSPFLIFSTDTFRADTSNERIGLPGYVTGVELYGQVLERLVLDNP